MASRVSHVPFYSRLSPYGMRSDLETDLSHQALVGLAQNRMLPPGLLHGQGTANQHLPLPMTRAVVIALDPSRTHRRRPRVRSGARCCLPSVPLGANPVSVRRPSRSGKSGTAMRDAYRPSPRRARRTKCSVRGNSMPLMVGHDQRALWGLAINSCPRTHLHTLRAPHPCAAPTHPHPHTMPMRGM